MDYILVIVAIALMWGIAWFAYAIGRAEASRAYAASLATARAKIRRLQRDVDNAHETTRMVRRGGAA